MFLSLILLASPEMKYLPDKNNGHVSARLSPPSCTGAPKTPRNKSTEIKFEFEETPVQSGFKMEGFWIWCGSMIRVDSVYHLFASRWPKSGPFPEGYRTGSEIVRATSGSPFGPFRFEEVVIGERDSSFWDSNMAHNPTIHKIGDEFVLFYIGSDFSTIREGSGNLLRRIGYARSNSIYGPWERSGLPIINFESNNPAVYFRGDSIMLMYRDADLRIFIAGAKSYSGPYTIMNTNVWPGSRLEDFYVFRSNGLYHMICEDNTGEVSGHIRWGVHLYSSDGLKKWEEYDPVIVYDHEIRFSDGSVLNCNRRERPQLLIEDKNATFLVTSVFDGTNSWSQPVKLKYVIETE
jgi:hypothetical protein